MLERLQTDRIIIGAKQSLRAIREGRAVFVVIADDAEDKVRGPVYDACRARGLTPSPEKLTMAQLGAIYGVKRAAVVVTTGV